jgi:uncharacterized phage infection (PIP) family protein YhgE
MTKNNKRDHTVQAMLKEVVAVEETYQQGTQWLDQLAAPVQDAYEKDSQIIRNLNDIADRLSKLRKKQRKSPQKSTVESLSPLANLNKTLNRVTAISDLFKKRKRDAGRIWWCLLEDSEFEVAEIIKKLRSIKHALKQ